MDFHQGPDKLIIKLFCGILCVVLLFTGTVFGSDVEHYETYVQINKSTEKSKLFVLVFVHKPGHKMRSDGYVASEKLSFADGDGAFFSFVLGAGESDSKERKHEYRADKMYRVTVSIEKEMSIKKEHNLLIIKWSTSVIRNKSIIYEGGGSIYSTVTDF